MSKTLDKIHKIRRNMFKEQKGITTKEIVKKYIKKQRK